MSILESLLKGYIPLIQMSDSNGVLGESNGLGELTILLGDKKYVMSKTWPGNYPEKFKITSKLMADWVKMAERFQIYREQLYVVPGKRYYKFYLVNTQGKITMKKKLELYNYSSWYGSLNVRYFIKNLGTRLPKRVAKQNSRISLSISRQK